MQGKKFVKSFRLAKIIQFGILLAIEIVFFLILLCNPSVTRALYSNLPLFLLCAIVWILMIFQLICLIYDFCKLRSFALESHELNKVAYLDELTGIPNRHGLDVIFRTYDTPQSMDHVGCCMITIDNLTEINERLGRQTGDDLIHAFGSILEKAGDAFGTVGRNGGNDFLCIINQCTAETLKQFDDALTAGTDAYNREHPDTPIRLRSASIMNSEAHITAFPELLIATYNKLYEEA